MSLILSGTDGLSDIDGSAATPAIRGTDANTGIFFPAADTIAFSEGGAEVMRIDSAGNVGIGTASPGYTLDVVGSSRVYSSTAGLNTAKFGASRAGDYVFLDGLCSPLASNGYSIFGMRAYSSLASAGVQVGGSEWVHEGAGTDNKSYYTISTHSGTALAERMRIDSSGNLLVGTQSAISGNAQITIVGSSTNRGALQMGRTTAATTGVAGSLVAYNGSNAICGIDWQSNGANNSGYIGTYTYNAGAFAQGPYLNTGGTNWTAASDERLKNVTGEIENALYKVSQIRAVEFTWKADTLNKQNIGFIAQDVQLVLPEVIDTDTNGNLGVRYAEVTSLLLAAIKEQQALILSLTTRLTALETP